MAVLGIDTAGPVVGAALWSELGVTAWSQRIVRKADSVLLPAVGELLESSTEPLDLVAVSVGPGAFTGLRVGVSAALGVALSRGVKVVAVSSLEARAAAAGGPRTLAILDARKGRVYAGLFDAGGDEPRALSPETDAALRDVLAELTPPFVAVGEGAEAFREVILAAGGRGQPRGGAEPGRRGGAAGAPAPGIGRPGPQRGGAALPAGTGREAARGRGPADRPPGALTARPARCGAVAGTGHRKGGARMSAGINVAVLGATGAVGRDLLEALPDSPLNVGDYRLIASRTSTASSIDVDGKSYHVHPLPEDLTTSPLLEGVSLVFLATPPDVSRSVAPQLSEIGVATVEIGGALAGTAPLVVPGITAAPLEQFYEDRIASSPSAPALGLAAVLAPLMRLGASSVRGTVLLSAGLVGQAGVKELSQQVISLFNGGTPERVVFPSGLAFDLNPQVGEVTAGWTGVERRIALEVARLVPVSPDAVALTAVMVPLFAGVGLSLFVELDPLPSMEDIEHHLSEADLLRLGDPVPGPRRLAGRPEVFVGRLRPDPLGRGVHLWAAMDNLRAGASQNAIAIALRLRDDGLL